MQRWMRRTVITIIVASINNDTKEVKLASIYRDTLLNIGNDTYTKANAAYAYGGPEQAISMLNTMLDLNITDYVTVNFSAMAEAVDALGGLDLPLSYAEMVFMNDYCIETSEETGKSYTPVELPDPKPVDEGGCSWRVSSEWSTGCLLLPNPLHIQYGYGTYRAPETSDRPYGG